MRTVCLLVWLLLSFAVSAGEINVQEIKQQWQPTQLRINPQYQITSSEVIDEAIDKGIVLTLIAKVSVHKNRDFWFDETIEKQHHVYEVRYFSLSGQYQFHDIQNNERNSFISLEDLWQYLSSSSHFDIPLEQAQHADYLALRLSLDTGALPSAMQLPVLLSSDWRFKSDWFEADISPAEFRLTP